ncbi:MAG: hypothetical protein IKW74_03690 [Thermoguttaceae bacterium]|nr:hypothetical protein [Thermoguttaceae bacterium]
MSNDNDDMQSPFEIPMDSADTSETTDDPRPFVKVDGRRYVLANNEPELKLDKLRENPRLAEIPSTPRKVSTAAKFLLYAGTSTAKGGWCFLCFYMLFVIVCTEVFQIGAYLYEKFGTWEPFATAKITCCESSGISSGHNKKILFAWEFEGITPDGQTTFYGKSYSYDVTEPGREVHIERRAGTKDILRVQGTSFAIGSSCLIAIYIFILVIGVKILIVSYFLWVSIRQGNQSSFLLQHGATSQGVPVNIKMTGLIVNKQPQVQINYRFLAADGKTYNTSVKTFDDTKLTDESSEILFYETKNPEKTYFLDDLPSGVYLTPRQGFFASLGKMVWPIVLLFIFSAEVILTGYLACHIKHATFSPIETTEQAGTENSPGLPALDNSEIPTGKN